MTTTQTTHKQTVLILRIMNVIAWIAFIGFCIEAGAIIFSYAVSLVNPQAAKNLYNALDLSPLKQFSFSHYTYSVFLMVALLGMKAIISFLAIKALSEVNLTDPFTIAVARLLEKICYALVIMFIIAIVNDLHADWLSKYAHLTQQKMATGEYLFIAALVFIISRIFNRGIEIQSENALTV
jgi:hypothetical protein